MSTQSLQFRDLNRQYNRIKDAVDQGIQDVINSTSFISGSQVKELEKILAEYVGVKHCISCANGTDAITISLMALLDGMAEEEKSQAAVFVPDFTFFSSGECPAALGLSTYFVDVNAGTYNLSPSALDETVRRVEQEGKHKPFCVIAVDLFGQPAEYETIKRICKEYKMALLEDGAQGFGGSAPLNGEVKMVCSFGDISTTSFFPAKPLGCYGDGGAIYTNDDHLADLAHSIAVHGKDTSNPTDPMAKYNNIRLGMNSRLDTLQAAILLAKFPTFKNFELSQVNHIAKLYNSYLSPVRDKKGITLPVVLEGYTSSWAQYTITLPATTPEGKIISRDSVQKRMNEKSIPTMVYYKKPMHKQGAFANSVSSSASCPVAEQLCDSVLCLPIHPYLEESEVKMICEELDKVL